jgi:hypothetical protein
MEIIRVLLPLIVMICIIFLFALIVELSPYITMKTRESIKQIVQSFELDPKLWKVTVNKRPNYDIAMEDKYIFNIKRKDGAFCKGMGYNKKKIYNIKIYVPKIDDLNVKERRLMIKTVNKWLKTVQKTELKIESKIKAIPKPKNFGNTYTQEVNI